MTQSESSSQFERWSKQIAWVVNETINQGPSAGDSFGVVFSEKEAKEYEISRFGRMTMKKGDKGVEYGFRAGPKERPNPALYHFFPAADVGIGEAIGRGDWVPDLVDLMKEIPDPVPHKEEGMTNLGGHVEKRLLEHLFGKYGRVVLMNPSYIGLKNARDLMPTVYLTDPEYREEVSRQMEELKYKNDVIVGFPPEGEMVYTGFGEPTKEPARFVRLVINPYSQRADGNQVSFRMEGDVIMISYMKRSRLVHDKIDLMDSNVWYSPGTVDKHFGADGMCFIKASEELGLVSVQETIFPHMPRFVPMDFPPYVNGVSDREGVVYDEVMEGTYFSRLARLRKRGLKVVDWVPMGRAVTVVTTAPIRTRALNLVKTTVPAERWTRDVFIWGKKFAILQRDGEPAGANYWRYQKDGLSREGSMSAVGYIPDEQGDYVIPGLGKGKKRMLWVDLDATPAVVEDPGPGWHVFLTAADLLKYKSVLVLQSANWNNWSTAYVRSDANYQSKRGVTPQMRIRTKLQAFVMQSWEDGIPVKKFADCWDNDPGHEFIRRTLLTMEDVVEIKKNHFACLGVQTQIRFGGEESAWPQVAGKNVRDVYNHVLARAGKISLSGGAELRLFGKWLGRAGFYVSETLGTGVLLEVWMPG